MGKAIALLLFLLLISPAVYAQTTHTVGGSSGWDTSVNYVNWAKGITFTVGDSLLFNYGFTHSVDEVSQTDYTNCNTGNAISSDANSPTTIPLSAAGVTRYFICPRSNHCSQGMKLAVTVSASATTPSPPSGTPSPPSGGASPSPPSGGSTPPASSTPSSPPPPNGNAATTLGGGKSLMVGLSVVLGALLGVMG